MARDKNPNKNGPVDVKKVLKDLGNKPVPEYTDRKGNPIERGEDLDLTWSEPYLGYWDEEPSYIRKL